MGIRVPATMGECGRKKSIFLSIFVLMFVIGCTPSETPLDAGETIKIGWIGPLTGDASNIGQSSRAATEIAVEEINAGGGIGGKMVEVIYEDGKCNAQEASKAANKLFNVDDVPLIIGGLCSSETMSFAPVAEELGRVVISYCSSVPALSQAGDYIFRTYPSDNFEGKFSANYLYNQGARKVAVLSCLSDWCAGLKDVFTEEFPVLGGEIVAVEEYEQTTRDLRTELTKLKSKDADTLYFVGYTEATIIGLRQIEELGWEVTTFGANAWDDPKIPEEAGAAADGVNYALVSPDMPDTFVDKMFEKSGEGPTLCAPQAYDTVYIIAEILENGAVTPEEMKNALYAMESYKGISGNIEFDDNGDVAEAELSVHGFLDGEIVKIE